MFQKKSTAPQVVTSMNPSEQNFDRVRVLFADQLNLARGKYVPRALAEKGEARFCLGAFAVTYSKDLVPAPGAGVETGLPDMEARFDPEDLRPGWEPNTKVALSDLYVDDKPSGLCGRSALKRAIAQWNELGFDPMIGLEAEAYIFQRGSDGAWTPYDSPGGFVYGTGPFTDPEELVHDIWTAAFASNLPVESINGEFDAPQFELVMRYDSALKACDDFFLFRQMAREILIKKGYLLNFMPKPIPDLAGTGMHINLSFRDSKGKNAFAGNTEEGNLSDLVKGCISGLIHHHCALGGVVAPTVNSYDRLQPASLSGYWANWGFDHRSVAVRVSGETGSGARIEHRVGDCAASPYFAVAAVLQAARLGYLNKYDLPDPEKNDGLETVNTDRHVASSLPESLDALESDTELIDAIGRPLIDNYVFVKRAEAKELEGKSPHDVFNYYAPFV